MKPVILAVLVLVLVNQNEALICYCGGRNWCPHPIEMCSENDDVCAVVLYSRPAPGYSKGCYKESDCLKMNHRGLVSATCCQTDLCN